MASFLERLTGKKTSSADQAKERLSLVLIHDRTDLSPEDLRSLKDRLIEVKRHGVVRETYRYDVADQLVDQLLRELAGVGA